MVTDRDVMWSAGRNPSSELGIRLYKIRVSGEEQPNTVQLFCAICGDDATGKHYGSISCDGCKGFFRRSVRRHSYYACRRSKNCSITKDKRNQCRYCRLRKCFRCGMKKEAVQNERDKITRPRPSEMFLPHLTVEHLRKVYAESREFCNHRLGSNPAGEKREANLISLCAMLKFYTCCLMEWAARIAPYNELTDDDRMMLCKSKIVQIFVLEIAYKSIHANDVILLSDDCVIPTFYDEMGNSNGLDVKHIGSQILDELVNPLADYQIDETEFACLKAALFFDPNVRGLTEDVTKIGNWRRQIASNLTEYISDRESDNDRNARCAEIWLLLLPLQRIGYQLTDLVQYAVMCGELPIDSFTNDILSGTANLVSSSSDRYTPRFVGDVGL